MGGRPRRKQDQAQAPDVRSELVRLAGEIWARKGAWQADPGLFGPDATYVELVARIRATSPGSGDLVDLTRWAREEVAVGPDLVLIAAALDLLPTAGDDPSLRDTYLDLAGFGPSGTAPPIRPHALRLLRVLGDVPPPLLSDLLFRLPPMWVQDEHVGPVVAAVAARLLAAGDAVDERSVPAGADEERLLGHVATIDRLADRLGPAGAPLSALAARIALRHEFGGVLRFETAAELGDPYLHVTPALDALADEIVTAVTRSPAGSVVVAGDPGSGRSTVSRLAASRLAAAGWLVVQASPEELAAGQIYVNQLDGRIQRLAAVCAGRRVVLRMPGFEAAVSAGRASGDPRSIADRLAGPVARGAPPILAEMSSAALDLLPRECAPLARLLVAARPPRYADDVLLDIGRAAIRRAADRRKLATAVDDAVLDQALRLSRHLLPHLAMPSALTRLLETAVEQQPTEPGGADARLGVAELFAGLTRLTGMPRAVLDETVRLDLAEVREWFTSRVLGQREAVDALVSRIALIKAGLTDPNRPYGTMLFVGPTGTGKTEIARALAEYLFGSPDRLIRIDMSELKTADSVRRLTATGDAHGRSSLASQVRANPFSVVLLDEFEKAATEVWDLFLQVFDAGRLTDEAGSTVDFRQTIVIVTSNLGSAIPAARGTGFGEGAGGGFSEDRVLRAVRSALRPELVNRFDRVVVFRPLPRDVMRRIVHHEIVAVLGRRGIAHRDWAVEVDEGAVDFLLDRGFTVDLGARPLRRAVERYLLAPLAEAIVTHEAPRGEQFLFVTAGDRRLDVQFVAGGEPAQPAASGVVDVEATAPVEPAPAPAPIARDPVGTRAELRVLRDTLAGLRDRVRTVDWDRRKTALLLQTAEPDFWDRPDRFVVLAEAETMDRTEAKILSAASLLDRLFALARDDQARLQRDPVARLARELLQLDLAIATLAEDGAQDALLLIEADEGGDALARDLQAMYEGWARSAGATCEVVERRGEAFRRVLLIEGLGVHRALAAETGIHVLERGGSRGARRAGTVHVAVEPWTGMPEDDPAAFAAHLARAGEERIVRRYQREPTPLVRDGVRRYRTGRLDRVLAGGFDLF